MRGFLNTYAKPDDIITLDGAGFAAIYEGKAPGNTVLFRCELDALPIHEINDDIAYRSVNDGVGHKCGHDGHMAILAGVAQTLTDRPANGRVVLLFQPDEETGTGARQCCLHEGFKTIQPDYAFALHNLPGYPAGDVICKPGTFASEVKYAAIKMVGVEAHSAQPETGVSPSFALAELTLRARTIQKRYDHPDAYALVIPVYNHMGVQASGVCPARGEVHFTLRSALGTTVEKMWQDLTSCAENIAESFGLRVEFETREEFAATTNHQSGFDMIWFGVYLMLVVEMAQITPPVGFNLFVLQGMTGHDMGFIARAAAPMFVLMIVAVLLLVWFPDIATVLPYNM